MFRQKTDDALGVKGKNHHIRLRDYLFRLPGKPVGHSVLCGEPQGGLRDIYAYDLIVLKPFQGKRQGSADKPQADNDHTFLHSCCLLICAAGPGRPSAC